MSADLGQPPEAVPALTDEQRARIEEGLSRGVFCSVYVNNAARITIDIKLPEGVTDKDTENLARAAEQAARELGEKIDHVLPEQVST